MSIFSKLFQKNKNQKKDGIVNIEDLEKGKQNAHIEKRLTDLRKKNIKEEFSKQFAQIEKDFIKEITKIRNWLDSNYEKKSRVSESPIYDFGMYTYTISNSDRAYEFTVRFYLSPQPSSEDILLSDCDLLMQLESRDESTPVMSLDDVICRDVKLDQIIKNLTEQITIRYKYAVNRNKWLK